MRPASSTISWPTAGNCPPIWMSITWWLRRSRRDGHVTTLPWLWIVFTVIAAAAQTVRNAMQRELTGSIGTLGATHVRFLFGFPFALVFLAAVVLWTGAPLPRPSWTFWLWVCDGSAAQIAAT